MANKFKYLESTSKPTGLLEQLEVAITLRPAYDGAVDPLTSWFGRLLSRSERFVWSYDGAHDSFKYNRKQVADAYFTNQLRYTAFDWDALVPEFSEEQEEGQVSGTLQIKGTNRGTDHCGSHEFTFKLVKEGGKWRLFECYIKQDASKCLGHGIVYE